MDIPDDAAIALPVSIRPEGQDAWLGVFECERRLHAMTFDGAETNINPAGAHHRGLWRGDRQAALPLRGCSRQYLRKCVGLVWGFAGISIDNRGIAAELHEVSEEGIVEQVFETRFD